MQTSRSGWSLKSLGGAIFGLLFIFLVISGFLMLRRSRLIKAYWLRKWV